MPAIKTFGAVFAALGCFVVVAVYFNVAPQPNVFFREYLGHCSACLCYPSKNTSLFPPNNPAVSIVGKPNLEMISSNLRIFRMPGPFPFLLASHQASPPYADGDIAQQHIMSLLQLQSKCSQNAIVVDVGGFLGDFGLSAAAMGCKVVIFEVQPQMVEIIKLSVRLNNFENLVDVRHNAVSEVGGRMLCFRGEGGQTNVDSSDAVDRRFCVETVRLDSVLQNTQSVVLLKIDVEGHELGVLKSASGLIGHGRVLNIVTEFTTWWTDRDVQTSYLPYVDAIVNSSVYCLHRTGTQIYGPISRNYFNTFFNSHTQRHLQTDLLVTLAGDEWVSEHAVLWSPDVLA